MIWQNDYRFILSTSALLLAIGTFVSTLEITKLRRELQDSGLLSWKILRLRRIFRKSNWLGPFIDVCFGYRGIILILLIRLICSLGVAGAVLGEFHLFIPIFLWGLVVSSLLLSSRQFFGQEGSDQMIVIVATALAVAYTFPNSTFIALLALFFIAGQLTLSYFVSGVAKLGGEKWRKGTALTEILLTRTYGTPAIGRILQRYPIISVLMGWFVIAFEVLFPLVFLLPPPVAWAFLATGLMFHVGNAVLMGLNGFVWAYLAAYPSLIYILEV